MAIYLTIKEDDKEHRVRLTQKPFFLGRSSKCHLTLSDNMISGRHLAIKINSDSRVVIKDLETTNGTYLNGSKVHESFLYLDDFIQIGKVKIQLDDSEMNAKELGLHKRDFERTSVTFVRLGAQVQGLEDLDEDEFGQNQQKTLLAKIRKKKEIENEKDPSESTVTTTESATEVAREKKKIKEPEKSQQEIDDLELKTSKKKKKDLNKKKKVKKEVVKEEQEGGLFGTLKGLFKK